MKKKTWITLLTFVVLVAVAVAVNWKFSLLNRLTGTDDPAPENTDTVPTAAQPKDTYFDDARYSRSQSRQEAVTILNSIINDVTVDEDTRQRALEEVADYARFTEGESMLENVIRSKGFADCIVFLSADTATVVVDCAELTPPLSAQIFDAVISQTGYESGAVKIVTYHA